MLKGFNARRRQRIKQKLAAQKRSSKLKLQSENLEDRNLLAVTAAGFQLGFTAVAEETTGFYTGPGTGALINFTTDGVGDDIISFQPATGVAGLSSAESSDYTLSPIIYPAGTLVAGSYTVALDASYINFAGATGTGGLQLVNDAAAEGNERLEVSISNSIALAPGALKGTIIEIDDNEIATVSLPSQNVPENPSGNKPFEAKLTISSTDVPSIHAQGDLHLEDTFSGSLAQSGGTATAGGTDYNNFATASFAISGGSFHDAESFPPFQLDTVDDGLIEGPETVGFSLTAVGSTTNPHALAPAGNAAHYVTVSSTGTVTIDDNEAASISFYDAPVGGDPISQATVLEGSGTGDITIYARLDLPSGSLSAPLGFTVTHDSSTPNSATYGDFATPTSPTGDFEIKTPSGYSFATQNVPVTHSFPVGSTDGAWLAFDLDADSGDYDDNYWELDEFVTLVIGPNLTQGTATFANAPAAGEATQFDWRIVDNETGSFVVTTADVDEGSLATATGANSIMYNVTATPSNTAVWPPTVAAPTNAMNIPLLFSGTASESDTISANPLDALTQQLYPSVNPTDGTSDYNLPGAAATSANDICWDADAATRDLCRSVTVTPLAGTNTPVMGTISVAVWEDLAVENDETVIATVKGTSASATAKILNDDAVVAVIEQGNVALPADSKTAEGATGLDPEDGCLAGATNTPSGVSAALYPAACPNDISDDDIDYDVRLQHVLLSIPSVVSTNSETVNVKLTSSDLSVADFLSFPTAITLPVNTHSVHVDLNELDDAIVEGTESGTVEFDLSVNPGTQQGLSPGGNTNVTVDPATNAVAVVEDNDVAKLQLRTEGYAHEFYDEGTFAFELINPANNAPMAASVPITVSYTLLGGTATLGIDYNLVVAGTSVPITASGTLVIPAGQSSVGITVQPINDLIADPFETIQVRFDSATAPTGTLADPFAGLAITDCSVAGGGPTSGTTNTTGTVTIVDDEGPLTIGISSNDLSANEDPITGVANDNKISITVAQSGLSSGATSGVLTLTHGDVHVRDVAGGGEPADYVVSGGVHNTATNEVAFTIPVGQTQTTIVLMAMDDNIIENQEDIDISIKPGSVMSTTTVVPTITPGTLNANILDNKDNGVISVQAVANTDEQAYTLLPGLPAPAVPAPQVGKFTFNLVTSGDDATDVGGWSDTPTEILFTLAGTASASEYQVFLDGTVPAYNTPIAETSPGSGIYSITLPGSTPTTSGETDISIVVLGNDDTLLEGGESVIVKLTSTGGNVENVKNDPQILTRNLTSTPGTSVDPTDSNAINPQVNVGTLSPNASPGGRDAVIWILDDDSTTVRVTATDSMGSENNGGVVDNGAFTFEVVGGAQPVDIQVQYLLTPLTGAPFTSSGATETTDYTISGATPITNFPGISGQFTIPANTASMTLPVVPVEDMILEGDEYFQLQIVNLSVPGLTGMLPDTSARPGATGTQYPQYNADNMLIKDDDVGSSILYRNSVFSTTNDPWNAVEEDLGNGQRQNAVFFAGLTNTSLQDEVLRFTVGQGTVGGLTVGSVDAELAHGGGSHIDVDTGLISIGPGSVTNEGFSLDPVQYAQGYRLYYVGLDTAPSNGTFSGTGREVYDVLIPANATQPARLLMHAQDDQIVEGTEQVDIDLVGTLDTALQLRGIGGAAPANNPHLPTVYGMTSSLTVPAATLHTPSTALNQATLYITEDDKAIVTYETVGAANAAVGTVEVTLDPEGTPGFTPGTTSAVEITVDKQIEGVLEIWYNQKDGTAESTNTGPGTDDYTVDYDPMLAGVNTNGSTAMNSAITPPPVAPNGSLDNSSATGGWYQLTNTPAGWTDLIPVASKPDAFVESGANEQFTIETVDWRHNNVTVTPDPFLPTITFPGAMATTTDVGLVEIVDDDILGISVDNAAPAEKNVGDPATIVKATIGKPNTTNSGYLTYYTTDGTGAGGNAISSATSTALAIGHNDYLSVNNNVPGGSSMVYWDGVAQVFRPAMGSTTSIGTSFDFNVTINPDDVVEGDQTFSVNVGPCTLLTCGVPGVAGATTASTPVVIQDDDVAKITIVNDVALEPNIGPVPGGSATNSTASHSLILQTDLAIEGKLEFDASTVPGVLSGGAYTPPNALGVPSMPGAHADPTNAPLNTTTDDYSGDGLGNLSIGAVVGSTAGAAATGIAPLTNSYAQIPLWIHDDALVEVNESVNVHFVNVKHTGVNIEDSTDGTNADGRIASAYTVGTTLADELIIEDTDLATLDVKTVMVDEGNGPGNMVSPVAANVPVQLVMNSNLGLQYPLTFQLTGDPGTSHGGAYNALQCTPGTPQPPATCTNGPQTQGPDFDATVNPTVTFSPGSTGNLSGSGAFNVLDEMIVESATETFGVTGAVSSYAGTAIPDPAVNASNISIGTTGVVTIKDNDSAIVKVTPTNGTENPPQSAAPVDGSFLVSLEDASGAAKVVDTDVYIEFDVGGTATRGSDYTFTAAPGIIQPTTGTDKLLVRIAAGQSSSLITMDVIDDTMLDQPTTLIETVELNSVSVQTASVTPRAVSHTPGVVVTATITDDEVPPAPTVLGDIFISGSDAGTWSTATTISGAPAPVGAYRLTGTPTNNAAGNYYHGATLPWVNLDTLSVPFAGTAPLSGDLLILGGTGTVTVSGFSVAGNLATWTLTDSSTTTGDLAHKTNDLFFSVTGSAAASNTQQVRVDVLYGDFVHDANQIIDQQDVFQFIMYWAQNSITVPAALRADFNGNGVVDGPDLATLLSGIYGDATLPQAAPLPLIDNAFADSVSDGRAVGPELVADESRVTRNRRRARIGQRNLRRRNSGVTVQQPVTEHVSSVDDVFASLEDDRFNQF